MFDIAPTELLMVAVIALVVIGPKDLPRAMRFVGKWMAKARGMARHFRSGLDTMMRESELEDLEKQWRQQNEDIMRQFPQVDAPAPESPSPQAEMTPPDMTPPEMTLPEMTLPEMTGGEDGLRPAPPPPHPSAPAEIAAPPASSKGSALP